jgi:hypothetical protein
MTNTPRTDLLDSLAKPPPPPSELDELINRNPLDLSAIDIDKMIAIQRQARARREAGGRTLKTAAEAGIGSGLDLAALVLKQSAMPKPAPVITKAAPGGFRRI